MVRRASDEKTTTGSNDRSQTTANVVAAPVFWFRSASRSSARGNVTAFPWHSQIVPSPIDMPNGSSETDLDMGGGV